MFKCIKKKRNKKRIYSLLSQGCKMLIERKEKQLFNSYFDLFFQKSIDRALAEMKGQD